MTRFDLSRRAALLSLALVLSACGGAPPAATAPTPSAPPAAPPTATAALRPTPIPPTATPAAAPPTPTAIVLAPTPAQAAGPLPAPVYLLVRRGAAEQIVRLERDSTTITQITYEGQAVLDFDVAPDAGTLVYTYGEGGRRTLVALDGGGRRELFSGEVSTPRITPDGQTVAFRLDNAQPGQITGQDSPPNGVWSVASAGGRPSLVQADDSLEGQSPPDGTAWTYTPIAYARGGRRLLLWAYNLAGPSIPGGELVILAGGDKPVRAATCCEDAQWSIDGKGVTITGGGPGPDIRFGLYRVDAATGAERPLIAQGDASYPLVTGARQLADGQIYAFYESVPADVYSWEHPFIAQMVRVADDGAVTPLRQDSHQPAEVLWRDDASGALIGVLSAGAAAAQLLWLDSSGATARPLAASGALLRWADTVRPLYAGECTPTPQVAWQPPATRAFSPGAADLQARLNALGLDAGPADGFFGDKTRAALQEFQAARSLPTGDALDCPTWQALLGRPAP